VLQPVRRRRARRVRPARLIAAAVAACVATALLVVRFVVLPLPGYSDTRGATVVHYRLHSRMLGRDLSEVAVIPRGGDRHPLLVFLHGRLGSKPWSWLLPQLSGPEGQLSNALFDALASLRRKAPVVVLLDGGNHSYYHDRRDGAYGSEVLGEAIPDAVRRFHTSSRIAIGGISMGGYGALHLAAVAPGRFCAVGGHSAALWEEPGASAPAGFDDAADFERNDVFHAAEQGRFDRIPVWLDVGTSDPFRSADTAFARILRRRGADVVLHMWSGGHAATYSHAHMRSYLRFYANELASCRITSGA
jgi:S-formylglutathione hydrolase FrmB